MKILPYIKQKLSFEEYQKKEELKKSKRGDKWSKRFIQNYVEKYGIRPEPKDVEIYILRREIRFIKFGIVGAALVVIWKTYDLIVYLLTF